MGKYQIESVLGRGAMGVVYLAHDDAIGRPIAIKVLDLSLAPTERIRQDFIQRFTREARAAGRLNHPNIVTIYDAGLDETGRQSYLAMEFLTGMRLDEKLAAGMLTVEESVNILYDIANALDYAHQQGVIHRDIKPTNIFVTPGGLTKIMDFGIARLESSELTHAGEFLGTPAYMSPEQAAGAVVDHRTDLFSLGIVAYEMLTGARPFAAESVTGILHQIANHHPDPPSHRRPEVPRSLDRVVLRLLEKKPEHRYKHGADAAKELARLKPTMKMEHPDLNPLATAALKRAPEVIPPAGPPAWRGLALAGLLGIALGVIGLTVHHYRQAAASAPVAGKPVSTAGGIPPAASGAKPSASSAASAPDVSAPKPSAPKSSAPRGSAAKPSAPAAAAALALNFEKVSGGGVFRVLAGSQVLASVKMDDKNPQDVSRSVAVPAGKQTVVFIFVDSDGQEKTRTLQEINLAAGQKQAYSVRYGRVFRRLTVKKG